MKHHFFYSFILFLSLFILYACNRDSEIEKHPDFTKNIIDVSNKIVPIKTNQIFGRCRITTVGKYLLLNDLTSLDKGFILFNKKTFKYLTSAGSKGQGPGQIINYQNAMIIPNTVDNKSFYVFDYSQLTLYKYVIDSMLNNPKYLPQEIRQMYKDRVIGIVKVLNDSTFIGPIMKTIPPHRFVNELSLLNIKTGKIKKFNNIEIKSKRKNIQCSFAISPNKDKCVQAYRNIDLLTIYDINGKLLCNVYGPLWDSDKKNVDYHKSVKFSADNIITTYLGGKFVVRDKNKRIRVKNASKLLVFDTKGNYQKTLDIGAEITGFCLDEENNRIIIRYFNRDEPLAYLDLKGILN